MQWVAPPTPVGEDVPVNESGFLSILWPATLSGRPLKFDILIATATNPTIIAGHYPAVQQIADAWDTPTGKQNLDYFHNNRKHGIRTFQDTEIARLLEHNSPAE